MATAPGTAAGATPDDWPVERSAASAMPVLLVLTTAADGDQAEALARQVLQLQLAACVALQPIRSVYHWQGQLEQSAEVQLLIKTDSSRLAALHAAVLALHSYTTPEWIVWPAQTDAAYGGWLASSCGLRGDGSPPAPGDSPGTVDPAG